MERFLLNPEGRSQLMNASSGDNQNPTEGARVKGRGLSPIYCKSSNVQESMERNPLLAVDVMIKKASVDVDFRKLLLEKRGEAAGEIGLKLSPAAANMLKSVPKEQLSKIIDNMTVPDPLRRILLGKMGYYMVLFLIGWMIGAGIQSMYLPVFSMGHVIGGD
jgi:hypothetical protein